MIDPLVKISRYYGRKKGYALGGGGNTSFKTAELLWVKASGFSLAGITPDRFAVLNRDALALISEKTYSPDPFAREQQVKDDLVASAALRENKNRPSVEASLHNLIDHPYIVHTHPYIVNALMCSKQARAKTNSLFGRGVLFVPYTDPGYILFKKIEKALLQYRRRNKQHPNIIFLQNHGVFVAGQTPREIRILYEMIFRKINTCLKKTLSTRNEKFNYRNLRVIKKIYNKLNDGPAQVFITRKNPLIEHYVQIRKNLAAVKKPFIPDQIVYCKTHPLWIGAKEKTHPPQIEKRLTQYFEKYGFLPRVILVENEGMIGVEVNEVSARLVVDVFEDAMKISYYSMNFGGPHFMNERQIRFIEGWEVENYRRNLLMKKNSK